MPTAVIGTVTHKDQPAAATVALAEAAGATLTAAIGATLRAYERGSARAGRSVILHTGYTDAAYAAESFGPDTAAYRVTIEGV